MPPYRSALCILLVLCATSRAAPAEVTEADTETRSEFGNITTYSANGGYERPQQGRYGGGYNAAQQYGGAGDYNRYPGQAAGSPDEQYNRPQHLQRPANAPPASQPGTTLRNDGRYNRSVEPETTRLRRQRNFTNRPPGELPPDAIRHYQAPGLKPLYRSPYDSSQYRDYGNRNYGGTQNPGYGQSNGNRPAQPVQPLEDGALPEGASDDAHYITR